MISIANDDQIDFFDFNFNSDNSLNICIRKKMFIKLVICDFYILF